MYLFSKFTQIIKLCCIFISILVAALSDHKNMQKVTDKIYLQETLFNNRMKTFLARLKILC